MYICLENAKTLLLTAAIGARAVVRLASIWTRTVVTSVGARAMPILAIASIGTRAAVDTSKGVNLRLRGVAACALIVDIAAHVAFVADVAAGAAGGAGAVHSVLVLDELQQDAL